MADILIVVDMQNDFITGSLGSKQAEAIVPKVYDKIKHFQGTVIGTLDTHNENYLNTSEGKKLPIPHCIYNTVGWRLHPDIDRILRCKNSSTQEFYIKNTFGSTDLAMDIADTYRNEAEVNITLVGLYLDICVLSNALLLKSFLSEANISIDLSCCAATKTENLRAAYLILESNHINLVRTFGKSEL